jgi:DNA-binding response OmpR family regulator
MARILIAEDDGDIRDLVTYKLKAEGHQITATRDGTEAWETCQSSPPELAVLDVMMPGMTGFEVCGLIKEHPDLGSVRVVLLTARSQADDIERGYAAGADDYILKPFSMSDLATRVAAVLER